MTDALLSCQALTKSFQLGASRLTILKDLQADFYAGGSNTIRGSSGSGKSTLLQILGGLETPEKGEVFWQGQSIYRWSRAKLAAWRNRSIGFVFQSYHLFPELSALENVEFPARLGRQGDIKTGMRLLDQVGLGARLHHRPSELSGGEQQRVAIARALRNRPALIFADEPTGNLDQETGRAIFELLLQLQNDYGPCLVLVTHDEALARRGQNQFLLQSGQLALAGQT